MHEVLWGAGTGALLSLSGWFVVRPVVGRDSMQVLARLVGVFLLKLFIVTGVVIALSRVLEHGPLVRYALALVVVLLPLGLLQAMLCVRLLKQKPGTES